MEVIKFTPSSSLPHLPSPFSGSTSIELASTFSLIPAYSLDFHSMRVLYTSPCTPQCDDFQDLCPHTNTFSTWPLFPRTSLLTLHESHITQHHFLSALFHTRSWYFFSTFFHCLLAAQNPTTLPDHKFFIFTWSNPLFYSRIAVYSIHILNLQTQTVQLYFNHSQQTTSYPSRNHLHAGTSANRPQGPFILWSTIVLCNSLLTHLNQWTYNDDGRHIAQIRGLSLLFGIVFFTKLSNFSIFISPFRHHWGPFKIRKVPHFVLLILTSNNSKLHAPKLSTVTMNNTGNSFAPIATDFESDDEFKSETNDSMDSADTVEASDLQQAPQIQASNEPPGRQSPAMGWDHTYEEMAPPRNAMDPRFLGSHPVFLTAEERANLGRSYTPAAPDGLDPALSEDSIYTNGNAAFLPKPLTPAWAKAEWEDFGLSINARTEQFNVYRFVPMEYQPCHEVHSTQSHDDLLEALCQDFPLLRDVLRNYHMVLQDSQMLPAAWVWKMYLGLFDRFNTWQSTKRQQHWRTFHEAQEDLILPPITDLLQLSVFHKNGKDPVHNVIAAALSTGWTITQNPNVSAASLDVNSLWRDFQANLYCQSIFTQIGVFNIDLTHTAFAPWLIRLYVEIRAQQYDRALSHSAYGQRNNGRPHRPCTEDELISLVLPHVPQTYYVPSYVHGFHVLQSLYDHHKDIQGLFLDTGIDTNTYKLPSVQLLGDRLARRINSRHKLYVRAHRSEPKNALVVATHSVIDGRLTDVHNQLRGALHEAMARSGIRIPQAAIDARSLLKGLMEESALCHHIIYSSKILQTIEAGIGHPGFNSVKYWTQELTQMYPSHLAGRPPARSAFRLPQCPRLVLELSYFIPGSRLPPGNTRPVQLPANAALHPASQSPTPMETSISTIATSVTTGTRFFHGTEGTNMAHPTSEGVQSPGSLSTSAPSSRRLQWTLDNNVSSAPAPPITKRSHKVSGQGQSRSKPDLNAPHDSTRNLFKLAAAIAEEDQTQHLTQVHISPLPPEMITIADSALKDNNIDLPSVRVEVYISPLLQTIAARSTTHDPIISMVAGQHASARVTFDSKATQVNDINSPRQSSASPFAWIRWAADLRDDGQFDGNPSSLQKIFMTAGQGWEASLVNTVTQQCQQALQRLQDRTIMAGQHQVAYTDLNEGHSLVMHLQAFLTCLATNNPNDPWLGQSAGSPLGSHSFLYDLGTHLDMLRIFITALTDAPTLLAYKPGYGERSVLLPLSATLQAGGDSLYGHRANLSLPNHSTLAELTNVNGNLLVFESLDYVYLHSNSRLHASQFYDLLSEATTYVQAASSYLHPPSLYASPHVTHIAGQLPSQYDWSAPTSTYMAQIITLDYVHITSVASRLDAPDWLTQISQGNYEDLHQSTRYAHTLASLVSEFGPSAHWMAETPTSLSYGSLQGVGQHLDPTLDAAMYLGTATFTDQISINPLTGVPNVYSRLVQHASTASTVMLTQPGSTLLAANIVRQFMHTGGDRLTPTNLGLPSVSPTVVSQRALIDTVNLLHQRGATSPSMHQAILHSLDDPQVPLPPFGSNYQQQVHQLLTFYLALMTTRTHNGLNAVIMLTLTTPGCTAPLVLAVTHSDGKGTDLKTEVFPLQHEATSRPHAKLLDISATFTAEHTFVIRVTYDNINMAAPPVDKAALILPSSVVTSPMVPTTMLSALPDQRPQDVVVPMTLVPSHSQAQTGHTVYITPYQAPKVVTSVVIAGIRFSLDPLDSDTSQTSVLSQLCNGLMVAGYYPYLPQTDGSPVGFIRAALIEARRNHPCYQSENTFDSYEIALPLQAPLSVGGTTTKPSLFTWCHNSKVIWERTPYTLQGLTAVEAQLYAKKWEMLVTREGIPGESNCDAYGRDTFHELVQSLLPPEEPILIIVGWIGSVHQRRGPKGKRGIRTSGPIQTAYFDPCRLPEAIENITRAIKAPPKATGPQWISLLKNQYGSYNVTEQLLSFWNPALSSFREFTFDWYTSSAVPNFKPAPYGPACSAKAGICYAVIKIPPALTAAELLHHYGQPGALPTEFIALRNWPLHPHFGDGISVLFPSLANRSGACILAVLNKPPALKWLPYKDSTLFQTVHRVHPAREIDRYHTTIGSLLHTTEITQDYSLLPDEMLLKYGLSNPGRRHAPLTSTMPPPTRTPSTVQPSRTYRQAAGPSDDASWDSSIITRDSRRASNTPSTVSSQSTIMVTDNYNVREEMQQQNDRINRLADLVAMLVERQLGPTGAMSDTSPSGPK